METNQYHPNEEGYRFLQNKDCPYFPCHQDIDPSEFSCLFCYCPLYALGASCGGNFTLTKTGIKDCSACTVPHYERNYTHVTEKAVRLIEKVQNEIKNHSESK